MTLTWNNDEMIEEKKVSGVHQYSEGLSVTVVQDNRPGNAAEVGRNSHRIPN